MVSYRIHYYGPGGAVGEVYGMVTAHQDAAWYESHGYRVVKLVNGDIPDFSDF